MIDRDRIQRDIDFSRQNLLKHSPMSLVVYPTFFYSLIGFGLPWRAGVTLDVLESTGWSILRLGFLFTLVQIAIGGFFFHVAGRGYGSRKMSDYESAQTNLMKMAITLSAVAGVAFGIAIGSELIERLSAFKTIPSWQVYLFCTLACGFAASSVGRQLGLVGTLTCARRW